MKRQLLCVLLSSILIMSSCNSYKEMTDYPNFSSAHHKKSGYQANDRNTVSHQKGLKKNSFTAYQPSSSFSDSISINEDVESVHSQSIAVKSNIQLKTRRSFLHTFYNYQGALTASLSGKPFITRHILGPDTTAVPTDTTSTNNKIIQSPLPGINNEGNGNVTKQNHGEVFAIISIAAALLAIVALAFTLPGVFILLAIAATVSGALGLKSKRRKMALAGMVLGILELVFLVIAFIYVLLVGFGELM
jgi:hypothetical protein